MSFFIRNGMANELAAPDVGAAFATAWTAAAAVATQSAAATASLLPKVGRARPHAEKSIGTPDPGAISLALAVTALASLLSANQGAA